MHQTEDDHSRIQFRDDWLYQFWKFGKDHRQIPEAIRASLSRKLDMLDAAEKVSDLRFPPGNHFENLNPPLSGFSSIRVNKKYRLIFKWDSNGIEGLYLDPHEYK